MPSIKSLKRVRRRSKIRARVIGTKKCPRLVVFRSLLHVYAQLIDDESGKTICASSDMKAMKGTRLERAALIGAEIAKLAKENKVTSVCFDRAGYKYHGIVKAIADGAREAGLKF
ncbi:MAG: 50S ribosomal protein L18 [Candidatus Gracilibacteria bacterium]|nr:50S ribosomal protein L18 [Candidatus Gracilibacteria bacterium]